MMGRGEGRGGREGEGGHWRKEMRSVEREDATPGGLKRMMPCRNQLPPQAPEELAPLKAGRVCFLPLLSQAPNARSSRSEKTGSSFSTCHQICEGRPTPLTH